MLFFVTLPNGSIIDIDLDKKNKVRDIIDVMDKSDKIQSLGLIDHFHLLFEPDTGEGQINLMSDLNKSIQDCGIVLESKIYMQTNKTTLLEIAMKNRLTPDFKSEARKIQKRFRGNKEREELREEYPDYFKKNKSSSEDTSQNSVPWVDDSTLFLSKKSDLVQTLQNSLNDEELRKHKLLGNPKSVAKKVSKDHLFQVYKLYSLKSGSKTKKNKREKEKSIKDKSKKKKQTNKKKNKKTSDTS